MCYRHGDRGGDEAVAFHDFPETGGVRDEVVAGPLPVALILGLDNALLRRKKRPWTAIRGGRNTSRRCQTAIEGLRGACWGGHQGAPKKRNGNAIRGGGKIPARACVRCRTKIVGLGAARW